MNINPESLEAMGEYYECCAQELKRRIIALIPKNPAILEMTNPFDLYHVPGFKCGDLDPTLAMATVCLQQAKYDYIRNQRDIDSEWQS